METAKLQKELESLLGDRFSTSNSKISNYARGEDIFDPVLPQAVAFPNTNEEISSIVKLCNKNLIPIVPFGTGTSLEGSRSRKRKRYYNFIRKYEPNIIR